jgi:Fe-S cluster assembly protein SufD
MEKSIFNNLYQYLVGQFDGFRKNISGEPHSIITKREQAFHVFKEKGFPSVKNEDWKYTNLAPLLKDDYKILPSLNNQADITRSVADAVIGGLDAYRLVFLNGKYIKDLSDNLPEGITCIETNIALQDDWVQHRLGKVADFNGRPMVALNTAFFTEFNYVHIAEKTVIKKPVHILYLYSSDQPAFIPHRLIIRSGKLSEAAIVETYHNISSSQVLISYVAEQVIEESAVLNICNINNLTHTACFVHHRESHQLGNSVLHHTNISFPGASFIRNDLNSRLLGMNTETNLWGLYLSAGNQLVDNHTIVDHQVPNCNSTEWYKGILQDESHGIFNGKIYVEKDAQKTNAFQQNNNLLLSEDATVNTKPQLEIYADDVKCSHGATVGQMNEDALFYLKTRGIGDETAHHLLVEAFAYDVLSKIEIAALEEYVRQTIRKNLRIGDLIPLN